VLVFVCKLYHSSMPQSQSVGNLCCEYLPVVLHPGRQFRFVSPRSAAHVWPTLRHRYLRHGVLRICSGECAGRVRYQTHAADAGLGEGVPGDGGHVAAGHCHGRAIDASGTISCLCRLSTFTTLVPLYWIQHCLWKE
jgi:hypothetical protein